MVKERHSHTHDARPLSWLLWVAPWAAVGTIAGLASPASNGMVRHEMVLWNVATWLAWIGITPAVLWLLRRAPPERQSLARGLAVHGMALAAITLAHAVFSAGMARLILSDPAGEAPLATAAGQLLGATLLHDFLAYGAVAAVGMAAEYRRRWRNSCVAAEELEAKASRAQLEALKMQLHPHFLFNTLHAVGVLVRKRDTRGALRMLIGLSDLLRMTLDNAGKQVVPLRQELDFLERYLRVEQVRFGDRLEIEKQIADDVLDAMVPSLALQPLCENAIRHGIAPRDNAGSITLRARRIDGDRLRIEVADDGVGLAEDSAELSGMGLANVRARLSELYGKQHHFEIADRGDRPGVVAIIEIPLQHKDEASAHE